MGINDLWTFRDRTSLFRHALLQHFSIEGTDGGRKGTGDGSGAEGTGRAEAHPEKTPAELYDPDRMPENLRKAHDRLDAEVDRLYRVKGFKDDGERLECLFELYREMTQGQQTE